MMLLKYFFVSTQFIIQIIGHNYTPKSPCPNIFQYRYDGVNWYGELKIKPMMLSTSLETIRRINVKVILTQRGRILSNYVGEIESFDKNQEQQNTDIYDENNEYIFKYKVKFPNGQNPPRIRKIFINSRLICSGLQDTVIVTTIINLEHTRTFSSSIKNLLPSSISASSYDLSSPQFIENLNYSPIEIINKICGRTEFPEFPVPNKTIVRGSWPWLAAIYVNNLTTLSYKCNGNIISSRAILTSAHCVQKREPNDLLIFIGRYNLNDWSEENSLAVSSENIFIHPDFDENLKTFDADIAIIILKNEIRFNNYVRPICLWTGSTNLEYIENDYGYLVGWTSSNYEQNYNKGKIIQPKLVQSLILSNKKCVSNNRYRISVLTKRNFCTANNEEIEICSGYSGTGLMISRNNRWTLRGIVSGSLPVQKNLGLSYSLCNKNKIMIFTDVTKFLDWILAFLI